MASDLLFSLREVEIKFGKKVIFQDLNLNLHKGDMIALVGKNGVGKTTLMKTIYGDQDLDAGELWNYPCLLYTSPSPRDPKTSRMPSSA